MAAVAIGIYRPVHLAVALGIYLLDKLALRRWVVPRKKFRSRVHKALRH
jgi:hypothetical protein